MTAILRVDDYSLFPFLRVGDGEGFSPTAGDKVDPEFAQSGLSEGQPLIDINENNGEFVIPVHLSVDATARTNLSTNPRNESATNLGDASADYALSRVAAADEGIDPFDGAYVTKHTYDGVNSGDSNSGEVAVTFPAAGTYTVSLHVWAATSVASMSAMELNTDASFVGSSGETRRQANWNNDGKGKWLRMSTTITVVGGDLVGVFTLRRTGAGSTVAEGLFYTCGLQIETGSAPTKYLSGSQGGAYWNGAVGVSTSTSYAGRQGLADLEKDVNRRLDAAATLEWKDDGLTYSTYYPITYARWEPEYKFRRAGARWMTGTIRVWTKPYGSAANGLGSMIASLQIPSLYSFASMLLPTQMGDIDSDIRVYSEHSNRSVGVNPSTTVFGLSVLPNASYRAFWPAASLIPSYNAGLPVNVVLGASGAAASQCLAASAFSGYAQMQIAAAEMSIPNGVIPPGEHRVLVTLRSRVNHGIGIRAFIKGNGTFLPIGPTAVATLRDWHLVDLGVFSVPTHMASFMGDPLLISVSPGGLASGALGASQPYPTLVHSSSYAASNAYLHINSMWLLPEETTVLIDELPDSVYDAGAAGATPGMPNASIMVDSSLDTAWYRNTKSSANADVAHLMRGAVPRIKAGDRRALVAFWSPQNGAQAAMSGATNAYVSVYSNERFRFAR